MIYTLVNVLLRLVLYLPLAQPRPSRKKSRVAQEKRYINYTNAY